MITSWMKPLAKNPIKSSAVMEGQLEREIKVGALNNHHVLKREFLHGRWHVYPGIATHKNIGADKYCRCQME